jgi:hypothetical protein
MAELAGLVAALCLVAGAERRGVFFEQTTVTFVDGVQAGPGVVTRTWSAGRRMRMEASGGTDAPAFILRLDEGRAFRLFPSEKTATEIDLGRLRARSQMDLSTAGALLGGAEEGEARTAELKVPRTIAGHACRGFRLTAGSTVLDLYVAPQIGLGIDDFEELLQWTGAAQALGALLGEMRKLPGFPLETRSRVDVLGRQQETVSTITRIQVGPQPPALFELPPGFQIVAESQDRP